MRREFDEITSGWTLTSGMGDLTERIERAAEWTTRNGPLELDEEARISLMIAAQIQRGLFPVDAEQDDAGREVWVVEKRDAPDEPWRFWDVRRARESAEQFLGWNGHGCGEYRVVRYAPAEDAPHA